MRVLSWLYLVVIFAFILLPVVTLLVFSFQDGRLPVPPFKGATLKWYADILADRALMEALGNSLLVAFVSALVALVLGFLAASGLARVYLPGTAVMRGLLIAPMTVSYLIIALGLLQMFNTVGLRRFGYSDTQVRALHQAYRLLYREGLIVKEALVKIEALKADFPDAVEQLTRFIEFIGSSPRGVIR